MLQSDSPFTTTCCSCLGAVHGCGERRDGAMLSSGCGKAKGDGGRGTGSPPRGMQLRQAEGARSKSVKGVWADRGAKWGHSFLGAADVGVRRRNRP
jgi:hypothetical protein